MSLQKDSEEYQAIMSYILHHPLGGSIGGIYAAVIDELVAERDNLNLLLFQPCGESHHDANKCPYCKENLNGKS